MYEDSKSSAPCECNEHYILISHLCEVRTLFVPHRTFSFTLWAACFFSGHGLSSKIKRSLSPHDLQLLTLQKCCYKHVCVRIATNISHVLAMLLGFAWHRDLQLRC